MKNLIFNNRGSIPLVLMIIVVTLVLTSLILSYSYYYTNINDSLINQHNAQQMAAAAADKAIQGIYAAIDNQKSGFPPDPDPTVNDLNNFFQSQAALLSFTIPTINNLNYTGSGSLINDSNITPPINKIYIQSVIPTSDPKIPDQTNITFTALIASYGQTTMGTKNSAVRLLTTVQFKYNNLNNANSPVSFTISSQVQSQ